LVFFDFDARQTVRVHDPIPLTCRFKNRAFEDLTAVETLALVFSVARQLTVSSIFEFWPLGRNVLGQRGALVKGLPYVRVVPLASRRDLMSLSPRVT
jgi:hypothetical protein